MEEFAINGKSGLLKITFEKIWGFPRKTACFGGYDVEGLVEIKSDGFSLRSVLWFTTGEVYEFEEKLKKCNEEVKGEISFTNYERDLKFGIVYSNTGHVLVNGVFTNQRGLNNELKFEFESDQSYIQSTLKELKAITEKYGDMKGIKI